MSVAHLNAFYAVTLGDETGDFVVGEYVGAMHTGIKLIGSDEAEGVNRAVGYTHCPCQGGVDGGLYTLGFLGVDYLCGDAAATTGLDQLVLIAQVVFGQRDEEAVVLFHAMAGYTTQDEVLANTLGGRIGVIHCIACAAVKQSVVASRGSSGKVTALKQQCLKASHGTVACRAYAGDASTYNNYIVFHCESGVRNEELRVFLFSEMAGCERQAGVECALPVGPVVDAVANAQFCFYSLVAHNDV